MKMIKLLKNIFGLCFIMSFLFGDVQENISCIKYKDKEYDIYPKTIDSLPDIPSPLILKDGTEIVIAESNKGKYFLIPVTLTNTIKDIKSCSEKQLEIDTEDFPCLAETGLHSEMELEQTKKITDRSIAEITELGRPGGLSTSGFLCRDENIISVLKGDNRLVKKLGLKHTQTAKVLFHVYNLILKENEIKNHLTWEMHCALYPPFLYNGKWIHLKVMYTRGGQKSIFNDEITGALSIDIWCELSEEEKKFIKEKYSHLGTEKVGELLDKLAHIFTGEIVPYYIMRYGFYEGHTEYRADPIAIAAIFGLKTIKEIENTFPSKLYKVFTEHFRLTLKKRHKL